MKVICFRLEDDEAAFINQYCNVSYENRSDFMRNVALRAALDEYMQDRAVKDIDTSEIPASILHWVEEGSFGRALLEAKEMLRSSSLGSLCHSAQRGIGPSSNLQKGNKRR